MANPRMCPHCHRNIPADKDFSFDENLNLICGNCGKVAYPTSPESELFLTPGQSRPSQKGGPTKSGIHHEDILER